MKEQCKKEERIDISGLLYKGNLRLLNEKISEYLDQGFDKIDYDGYSGSIEIYKQKEFIECLEVNQKTLIQEKENLENKTYKEISSYEIARINQIKHHLSCIEEELEEFGKENAHEKS